MKYVLGFTCYMMLHFYSFSQSYDYKVKIQEDKDQSALKILLNDVLVPVFSENNAILKIETSENGRFIYVSTKYVLNLNEIQPLLDEKYGVSIEAN